MLTHKLPWDVVLYNLAGFVFTLVLLGLIGVLLWAIGGLLRTWWRR